MIEINLLETKKPFKLPEILGVDLNIISIRAIVLAVIISYIPSWLFIPTWESEKNEINKKIAAKNKILRQLQAQTKGQESFKEQIEEFAKQEKKLEQKLAVVKKIIEQRKNPMSIMLYLTKNIPKDVWLTEMNIKDEKIKLSGRSSSFVSIGDFVTSLQKSVFFNTNVDLKTEGTQTTKSGNRVEKFSVSAIIKRFD